MEKLDKKVYCSSCKGKTNHEILLTHSEVALPYHDFHWHSSHHIVRCLGCETVCFVERYGDEDTWEYINGERVWKDIYTVYPEEPKNIKSTMEDFSKALFPNLSPRTFENAPEDITNLYTQIIDCFNRNHHILCTSGIRTLIEGICNQLKIKKGYLYVDASKKLSDDQGVIRKHESLPGRIFEMYDKGYILFDQALILNKIVKYGNDSIHDLKTPDYSTLKEIINILEKVVYDVYELKNHALLKEQDKK